MRCEVFESGQGGVQTTSLTDAPACFPEKQILAWELQMQTLHVSIQVCIQYQQILCCFIVSKCVLHLRTFQIKPCWQADADILAAIFAAHPSTVTAAHCKDHASFPEIGILHQ